jgi:pilus assembly protein Flp/PilA
LDRRKLPAGNIFIFHSKAQFKLRIGIDPQYQTSPGETMMNFSKFLNLHLQNLINREDGQDLVEYALVVALISFGAIASMQFLATGINEAFSEVAVVLTSNIA